MRYRSALLFRLCIELGSWLLLVLFATTEELPLALAAGSSLTGAIVAYCCLKFVLAGGQHSAISRIVAGAGLGAIVTACILIVWYPAFRPNVDAAWTGIAAVWAGLIFGTPISMFFMEITEGLLR